jgi:hypothetical protein
LENSCKNPLQLTLGAFSPFGVESYNRKETKRQKDISLFFVISCPKFGGRLTGEEYRSQQTEQENVFQQ